MKQKVILNLDIDKITKDILMKEDGGYSSIEYGVQRAIRDEAITVVKNSILENLNLSELKEKGYSKEYLKKEAKDILDVQLKTLTDEYIQEWITNNMKFVVEKALRNTLDTLLLPRLEDIVKSLLVVDQSSYDERINELEEQIHQEAKGAYEAGQMAEAERIKREI